jgi:hypothetical protein
MEQWQARPGPLGCSSSCAAAAHGPSGKSWLLLSDSVAFAFALAARRPVLFSDTREGKNVPQFPHILIQLLIALHLGEMTTVFCSLFVVVVLQ